jgi:hypothetical protein
LDLAVLEEVELEVAEVALEVGHNECRFTVTNIIPLSTRRGFE